MAISKIEVQVRRGSERVYSFYPSPADKGNHTQSFEQAFAHKGIYIVHVLLNDAYAFTYSVKVK